MRFTSNAEWPEELGLQGNRTSNTHESRKAAQEACWLLERVGFENDGWVFPVRTWVEEVEGTGEKTLEDVGLMYDEEQE